MEIKRVYSRFFNTINRVNTLLPKSLGQFSRQNTSGKDSLKKQTVDVGGRYWHGHKKCLNLVTMRDCE